MRAFDAIPAELRERPQWVVWSAEKRDGKTTKVPYRADLRGRASSTDPATWSTFDAAVVAAKAGGRHRLRVLGRRPVRRRRPRRRSERGRPGAIIAALDSYTETSVSGTGVHVIIRAGLNGHRRNRHGPFEVYEQGRYFFMTGEHVRGTPTTIEERQAELEEVLASSCRQADDDASVAAVS